jgi:hypothetical protein
MELIAIRNIQLRRLFRQADKPNLHEVFVIIQLERSARPALV